MQITSTSAATDPNNNQQIIVSVSGIANATVTCNLRAAPGGTIVKTFNTPVGVGGNFSGQFDPVAAPASAYGVQTVAGTDNANAPVPFP